MPLCDGVAMMKIFPGDESVDVVRCKLVFMLLERERGDCLLKDGLDFLLLRPVETGDLVLVESLRRDLIVEMVGKNLRTLTHGGELCPEWTLGILEITVFFP